ncbi:uncharacterized protein LOC144648981 [Oculina patagonica]
MQLEVFFGFVLLLLCDGAASERGGSISECERDEVFCRSDSRCVPRLAFRCGDDSCGMNEKLCGSPLEMKCIAQNKECPPPPDRADNGSSPSRGGNDNVNRPPRRDDDDDDDDDNPFSRGPPDGRDDFDRNETRSLMNETRLRGKLRRSFNPSFIDEIIGLRGRGNGSFGDHQHGDKCARRYSSCVKTALANLMFLSDLDGECCKMTQDPQRFAQRLRNISRQFTPRRMDCPEGTRFCPFSFVLKGNGCIPVRGNFSGGLNNDSDGGIPMDDHSTPWGNQSRKGFKVCEVLMRGIRDGKPCSHRHLLRWLRNKNDSISRFGKACPGDKKFCPSSFDCRSEEEGCHTDKLRHWASKNLCNSSERLCLGCSIECRLKDEECPRAANMSKALREAALALKPENITDEALRMLSKSGWASFCFLKKALATCILERLKECLSQEVHCRDTGYESHKKCMSGEGFCRKVTNIARPLSTENHRLCSLLRTNPDKFEREIKRQWTRTPWGAPCFAGGVFCPLTMECVPEHDLSNCTTDRQFFQQDLVRAPWNVNHTQEAGTRFCRLSMSPAPNGSCSFRTWLNWQARRNRSCSPFGRCCPNGQRFSLSAMKCFNPQDKDKLRLGLNHTKCDPDDQVFCDRQQVCLPKHVNCTDPVIFDYFSVSRFANKSGWAAFCSVLYPFTARLEHGFKKCRRLLLNGTCSAQITCSDEEQFCRRERRCVPKGNCSSRPPPPDHKKPTPHPTDKVACNHSDLEALMLWSNEPIKYLFPADKVPDFVGLLGVGEKHRADLQFKSDTDDDWKPYKGCGDGQMRVVSSDSALRFASCAHGFLPFEIDSAPENSVHGQCVNTADSLQHRDTVIMVLLPTCAAGLDIAVIRPNITMKEDRPSNKEPLRVMISLSNNGSS